MADFGQLNAYRDDYDFAFTVGKKRHKIKPSVDQVLDYRRQVDSVTADNPSKTIDPATIWELTAPLLGGRFNRDTYRFEAGEEGDNAHLLPDLIEAGADFETIDRLLSSVYAKYQFGDEVAEELMKTGDLGKALRNIRLRKEAEEKATHQDTGATGTSA